MESRIVWRPKLAFFKKHKNPKLSWEFFAKLGFSLVAINSPLPRPVPPFQPQEQRLGASGTCSMSRG